MIEYVTQNMDLSEKGFLLFSAMFFTSVTLMACFSDKSIQIGSIKIDSDSIMIK